MKNWDSVSLYMSQWVKLLRVTALREYMEKNLNFPFGLLHKANFATFRILRSEYGSVYFYYSLSKYQIQSACSENWFRNIGKALKGSWISDCMECCQYEASKCIGQLQSWLHQKSTEFKIALLYGHELRYKRNYFTESQYLGDCRHVSPN